MIRPPRTLYWDGDALVVLDQTRLPLETVELRCRDVESVCDAIRRLAVRGAPAIGVAAAYGVAIAARRDPAGLRASIDRLRATRPTAVNLFWALERMRCALEAGANAEELLAEARRIEEEDAELCRRIGEFGAELLPDPAVILTHCNAGALATAGRGTALAVVYAAVEAGKRVSVFADETRPLLQGARITAYELRAAGVPVTLLPDSAAASLLRRGEVSAVIVGADRIAANGDAANKIGTYPLALAAREHGVPFHVAAPWSTVDLATPDGAAIPIEERGADEVLHLGGRRIAPEGVSAFNPAFDVTPARLITRIITDRGVIDPSRQRLGDFADERMAHA